MILTSLHDNSYIACMLGFTEVDHSMTVTHGQFFDIYMAETLMTTLLNNLQFYAVRTYN